MMIAGCIVFTGFNVFILYKLYALAFRIAFSCHHVYTRSDGFQWKLIGVLIGKAFFPDPFARSIGNDDCFAVCLSILLFKPNSTFGYWIIFYFSLLLYVFAILLDFITACFTGKEYANFDKIPEPQLPIVALI